MSFRNIHKVGPEVSPGECCSQSRWEVYQSSSAEQVSANGVISFAVNLHSTLDGGGVLAPEPWLHAKSGAQVQCVDAPQPACPSARADLISSLTVDENCPSA